MSNESENKRIELTEFEGLGKGEQHPKHLFEEVEKRFNDGGVKTQPLYLDEAFVNAIIMLPDLIAELKRSYRYMDSMNEELANWRRVIEIFDPHSSYPELNAAFNEVFGD